VQDVLIHLHVPKCAGSALSAALQRRFGARALNGVAAHAAMKAGDRPLDGRCDAVFGHLTYGVHALFDRPCVYLSATRDPIERICSYFNYVHARPRHPLHAAFRTHLRSLDDLRGATLEAIPGLAPEIRSPFCRVWSGRPAVREGNAAQIAAEVEARVRAGRLVVGTPAEAAAWLARRIGPFALGRHNVTDLSAIPADVVPARPETLGAHARALLERYNRFDVGLIERVGRLNAELGVHAG
jgi:hypothetical protein